MSSPEALAAVTATLKDLLKSVVGGDESNVTMKPPSVARNGTNGNQLNIFLYSVHYNPAFRNEPMPGKMRNGEAAHSPMPLILKYLITAYGENDEDILGQTVMGKAMSILHDHPVLSRAVLKDVSPDSGLYQQVERVRITPDTLSLDDMSKLWSSFQSAEYRLSVGYEISVVLIESSRKGKAAPPVLKRGEEDQGPESLLNFPPSLTGLRFKHKKIAVELGEPVTLLGEHLSGEKITVYFHHSLFKEDEYRKFDVGRNENENEITVNLPEKDSIEGTEWPVGLYTVYFSVQLPNIWTSNQIAMPLAPTVLSVTPKSAASDTQFALTVTCKPQIRASQQAVLLFGDQMITPDSITNPSDIKEPSTALFTVKAPAKTQPYLVRLRVDGVDSIPVDFSDSTPKFATNQQVTVS